jgi:hypothetical protein
MMALPHVGDALSGEDAGVIGGPVANRVAECDDWRRAAFIRNIPPQSGDIPVAASCGRSVHVVPHPNCNNRNAESP